MLLKSFMNLFNFNLLLILLIVNLFNNFYAQEKEQVINERENLLNSARQIMTQARFCALITKGENGQDHARTMDPFPPDENFVIWFGTNTKSRKAEEIRKIETVTLYYSVPKGSGHVSILGMATLVDDTDLKDELWKKEWKAYYPDNKDNYILMKVAPEEIEVIDYKRVIIGENHTWEVPKVKF